MSDIEVVLCSKLFLEDFWSTIFSLIVLQIAFAGLLEHREISEGEGRNGKMSYVSIFDIIFLIGRIDL